MNKKSVRKALKTKAENLWKEVCKLRDRNMCALCGSTSILQIDHCFSRTNSELFFDIKNGTTLCRSCHFKKSKNLQNYSRLVDRKVILREGQDWFTKAEEISMSLKPYIWDVIKLEQLVIKLKEKRAEYLQK